MQQQQETPVAIHHTAENKPKTNLPSNKIPMRLTNIVYRVIALIFESTIYFNSFIGQ